MWQTCLMRDPYILKSQVVPHVPFCFDLNPMHFSAGGPSTLVWPGVFILNIKSYFNATWFLVLAMLYVSWLWMKIFEHMWPFGKLWKTGEVFSNESPSKNHQHTASSRQYFLPRAERWGEFRDVLFTRRKKRLLQYTFPMLIGSRRIHETGIVTYSCLIVMLNVGKYLPYKDATGYELQMISFSWERIHIPWKRKHMFLGYL